VNLTAACNTGARCVCNHGPCDCSCHGVGLESIIQQAIEEWAIIARGPHLRGNNPSLAHYIATRVTIPDPREA
jgi:hypothetical protein